MHNLHSIFSFPSFALNLPAAHENCTLDPVIGAKTSIWYATIHFTNLGLIISSRTKVALITRTVDFSKLATRTRVCLEAPFISHSNLKSIDTLGRTILKRISSYWTRSTSYSAFATGSPIVLHHTLIPLSYLNRRRKSL